MNDIANSEVDLKTISNLELKSRLERLVHHERKLITLVLEHIAEVERRKLYLEWNFLSLYDYLTRGLKYSGSAAHRRVQAARALVQVPTIKKEIESGALNLTQIVQVQTAINHEQKTHKLVAIETKKEIFAEISNRTTVETEKILDHHFESAPTRTIERHKHDDSVELTVRLPSELYKKMKRIRELCSHVIPNGEWTEVLEYMSDDILKRRDPLLKKNSMLVTTTRQSENANSDSASLPINKLPVSSPAKDANTLSPAKDTSAWLSQPTLTTTKNIPTKRENHVQSTLPLNQEASRFTSTVRRPIRSHVRRFIFQRDRNCQYRNSDGSVCGSCYQLEIDHIQPKFAGGSDEPENLRLHCRTHNAYRYAKGR